MEELEDEDPGAEEPEEPGACEPEEPDDPNGVDDILDPDNPDGEPGEVTDPNDPTNPDGGEEPPYEGWEDPASGGEVPDD